MRLEIRQASHREEVSTESDFVVFGRDPQSDVVIRDPRCSRRHASLRVVPEGFHLLDLGSSNGTFVLGQRVDDAIIREGDVFSLGNCFIRVLPEDIPPTLAMPGRDATVVQTSLAVEPPRRAAPPPPPPPPPEPERAPRPQSPPPAPRARFARPTLGAASILVGLGLIGVAWSVGSPLGALAFFLPALGTLSIVAGFGHIRRSPWARGIHYALFTIWLLSCLLTPFGGVGITYQIKGEDQAETDGFFAVVIGVALFLALAALVGAALLARLYVPAPVPL